MEISRIRMVSLWRARFGEEVMQVRVCEPGLGKVDGPGRKYSCIMVPIFGVSFSPPLAVAGSHHLPCGTSQIRAYYCDNLKNLAFPIEPAANPIRPTLRDGH